jgi:hypothetical protein
MPATVRLKGDFDTHLKQSHDLLESAFRKLVLERAKPTIWTASQVDVLGEFYNALGHLEQAVANMAIQVRDD